MYTQQHQSQVHSRHSTLEQRASLILHPFTCMWTVLRCRVDGAASLALPMERHSMDWLHISAASVQTAGSSFDASPERAISHMILCFRSHASFEVDSRSWAPEGKSTVNTMCIPIRELGKEDVISLLDQALGATALCNSYLGHYSHNWLPPRAHVHVGEPCECVMCVYLSSAPVSLQQI